MIYKISIYCPWAELPKIIIENKNVYKFLDFDIRKTYVDPSWPPSVEYDAIVQLFSFDRACR